jgi:radical SAM superfamily enzyme YgiQ (UPF0313 family)
VRILLINPPRSPANAIHDWAPPEARHLVHRKLIGPPLGLLTVAAAVEDRHEVSLLELKGEYDLRPDAPPPEVLVREAVESFCPDVAGVTFIASEHPAGMSILREIKRCSPEVLTVAGGLHAILCPEHFDDPAVDIVFVSQAAQVFGELMDALARGRPLDEVGGVLVRGPSGLRPTPAPPTAWAPAGRDYLVPDRSLIEPWLSTYVVGKATGPSTYLFTSLGCPHRCTFCSIWHQYGGAFHQRDVESVVAELATLDQYQVVRFADANTVVDLDFASRLFDRIAAEGIRFTYVMDIRVDTAIRAPWLIEKMARGGLKVVIAGFESFRSDELRRYRKKLEPDQVEKAVRIFHDNGIMVRGNYVISPDYDERDFEGLAAFASEHRVALAGYTILTPMPGTDFHREVRDQVVDHDLSKYNFFNCVLRTKLPLESFYEHVGDLWRIRLGTEVI